jgi:hypothetical protein
VTVPAPATEQAVRTAVTEAWGGNRPATERLLLLRASPVWPGPATLTASGVTVRVVGCPSTLAVRDQLTTAGPDERLVVLTDVEDDELGVGLLSHAVRQRRLGVDVWDSVRQVFRVRRADALDGALVRDGEVLARALVDRAPPEGWTPPPSGVLSRDHAYEVLVDRVLGLDRRRLDVAGLLTWSRQHEGVLALQETEPRLQRLLVAWLRNRLGTAAGPGLDLVVRGHGTDVVPLGVAAGLLWGPGSTDRVRGHLEARLFDRPLTTEEVAAWSESATGWVERTLVTSPPDALAVLNAAERVLTDLGAEHLAAASEVLPAGQLARCADLGQALQAAATGTDPARVRAAEAALHRLEGHRLSEVETDRLVAARAGVRLLRWLRQPRQVPPTAHEALLWQVREGGWVDRARQSAWNGADVPELGSGLAAVLETATAARTELDRASAALVASAVAAEQPPGQVVPVEDAIVRVVLPLATERPVLLLVLDGMSAAVASELAESVLTTGWTEQLPDSLDQRQVLLAGLPSVTEVSRTSLLSGRLQQGGQSAERRGLSEVAGPQSALFHLADLAGSAGTDLPLDVREAVLDLDRPVVATVLNAVDDSLSSGDPGRTRWTVDAVRHLRPLLERAAVAGRIVVLVSDHGHVVDRPDTGTLRSIAGGGARWRPATSEPLADEVLLAGPRVVLGEGRVVAAVDEGLRYRARKEGYHGGCALAEISIPVVVLLRRGASPLTGWRGVGPQAPAWWDPPVPVKAASPDSSEGTLFELG